MSETVEIERDMDYNDVSFINLLLLIIIFKRNSLLALLVFRLFFWLFLLFFGFPSPLDEVSDLRLKDIWIEIMRVSFNYYFWGVYLNFFLALLAFFGFFWISIPTGVQHC